MSFPSWTQGPMESRAPPPPETSGQSRAAERPGLTRRELDLLYEEALYTTVNRAGVTSGEYVTNEGELFRYLQEVFKVGPDEHDVILQRVREAKRASYALKVSVMEGKNLLAKDANGYSDPYCMLGILLGQSPKETEEKKERKFSFRKKKDKFEKRSSVREVLPARYIQVTEVKPETLNPVWNEHFVFEIDDVYSDQLHLDIWDHDDDVSVSEACKKLNEISSFKGMGRYFKQIAKSVRANGTAGAAVEENVDDFLGCLNISIHEIPVAGVDKWFKLEPRSSTSSVQGECRLILKLTTTQNRVEKHAVFLQRDTVLSKKDSYMRVHEMLLHQILEYEHAQFGTEPYSWSGDLSKPAWTVLSHHAVQTDLSPLQQAIMDAKALALCGFHEWFKTSIHKWLQIVHDKSCDRIRKAVEVDKLEHVDALSKHSSSAVDVTTCFNQVKEFWVQLAWPDSAGAFIFVARLTDDMCSAAVCYSELIKRKIEKSQHGQENKHLTNQLCIALNNIEHVRKFLGNLPRDLDWKSLEVAMQESCGPGGKEQVQKALNAQLLNVDLDLQREVKRMIARLTDKMVYDLKKYIQHISLSPDSIHNDDAVSPLMKYLDDTLVILSESLVKANLDRVLQGLWTLLLKLILDTVAENRGVSVEFYGRFYYTAKALVEELRLNKCSSNELIEQYYLEKIGQQKTLKQTKFGRISVKCYYEASEQKLYVEILHAADLIALDTNEKPILKMLEARTSDREAQEFVKKLKEIEKSIGEGD
ncbi:UNVERIFIED_CONTAM: hypothetical protein FKN15_026992 [Acipenser sinensis]